MTATWPYKDPDEVLDYYVNWLGTADEPGPLYNIGDLIVSSTWEVPTGIVKDSDTFAPTGLVTIWLSGGTIGETYFFVNHITTQGGREFDKTVKIRVKVR